MFSAGVEFDRTEVPFTRGFNKTDSSRFYMTNLNCLTKITFCVLNIRHADYV